MNPTQLWQLFKKKLVALKTRLTLPNIIIAVGILTAFCYAFSFLFPFTDNAFVMNNLRPVAAQVSGYITHIDVKNGDYVQKGQRLFTVFKKPYEYAVDEAQADLEAAKAKLLSLRMIYERDLKLSEHYEKIHIKLVQDDSKYRKGYDIKSVSLITLQNTQQETQAAKDKWQASLKQLAVDEHEIKAQEKFIEAIRAKLNIAKVNLELTDVRAQFDGIVQNLFFSIGAPIIVNQPLFSLVDPKVIYIQANFNETDLREVKKGSKVWIFPRMYLGTKVFRGVVESDYWSANRQIVDERTQLQNVVNENQWILLPQRMPVIIRVTDPDPDYPLRVGSSAYVYISAKKVR